MVTSGTQLFPLAERVRQTCRGFAKNVLLRDDGTALTGEQLWAKIEALRPTLETLSPEGGRVGILFFNGAARALAILAALALRRVPVILDASDRFRQIERNPQKLRLAVLLASAKDFSDITPFCSTVHLAENGSVVMVDPRAPEDVPLPRPGTALILYTSGSTGERKGVQVPAKGILYTVAHLIEYFELDESTKATVLLPLCHSMGLNTQFLPTFFAGGESYLTEISLTLNRCYRGILEHKATFVGLISELLLICAEERERRGLPVDTTVRHVQLAGGMIRKEHLAAARSLFPNAVLHKGYGLTEAIRISMTSSIHTSFYDDGAGYLLPEQTVEIRNSEGQPITGTGLGQIFVKSPNVMLGYDNVPEHPIGEDGFLATGDLARFSEDGRLIIHGRGGSIFKVAGDWVSAMEIERVASESTTAVRDVKCLPVPDTKLGHRAVLFVEVAEQQRAEFLDNGRATLEQRLAHRLPRVWLPKDVFVVDKFPRTANGKLQNHVLTEFLRREEAKADPHARRPHGFRYKVLEGHDWKGLVRI